MNTVGGFQDRFDLRTLIDTTNRGVRTLVGPAPGVVFGLARTAAPEPARLVTDYMVPSRPGLFRGIGETWPAATRWSLGYLRERFGDRSVPAIPTRSDGVIETPESGLVYHAVRFADIVAQIEHGSDPGYYVSVPSSFWPAELAADVTVPEYCRTAGWRSSRLWLNKAAVVSPLHRDLGPNLLVQIIGRKRILLYPRAETPWLYSHPVSSGLPNLSRFDPEQPDFRRFPHARSTRPLEVTLQPGDALFLPSLWWHHVRSMDTSVSVNFWWADGLVGVAKRATEFLKRIRKHDIFSLNQSRSQTADRTTPKCAALPIAGVGDKIA